jgi:hypothetical protein
MSVFLRATNDKQQTFDLELLNIPELLLDISAIEAGEIGKIFGTSSQTFALPGDDNTNKFFGNLFDIGATPAIGLTHTVPCQVLFNGQSIFTGKLYVDSIVTGENHETIYNCVTVDTTIDFRTRVDNRALADLNWSAYNHDYTFNNISSSWNDDLLGGAILYPLVHYGKDPNATNGSILEFGGGAYQVDNPFFPLLVTDFKPAIRAKDVVDTIFADAGFEYESNFFDSAFFNELYLLPTSDDKKGANINNTVSQSVNAIRKDTPQNIVETDGEQIVGFDATVFDNGNNYNTTTFEYTADVSGLYNVRVRVPFSINNYQGLVVRRVAIIKVNVNGNPVQTYTANLRSSQNGVLGFNWFQQQLAPTDILTVSIQYLQTPSVAVEQFRISSGLGTFLNVQGPPGVVGGNVDMALQFPNDLKVLDFINSLALKFNLVIQPVPDKQNTLTIEPFNDWVDAGNIINWTDKVDRSVKWEIKHPLDNEPKNILFTDELDDDEVNQYRYTNYGDIYGQYTYESDSDLTEGTKEITPVFAATPVKVIPNAQTVVVPFLYKKEPNKYPQPYKFKPRLLFKSTLKEVTGTEARGVEAGQAGYFFISDGSTTYPINYYRTLLPTTDSPVDFNTSFDIHYNNINFWPFQANFVPGTTKNAAFSTFWAYYINELYDVDTRLVTMNIVLKPTELPDIKLNDKIFIDGHYYRINKINGANVIEESSVEIELLKTLPRKLQFPRRRIYFDPNNFTDVIQGDYNFNGTVVYNDFETGTVITSSQILDQASTRDNLSVYSSSVVWDTVKPIIFNPNVITVGTVDYDETSNNVLALGNNINIPQSTNNVAILVPTRELDEYKENTSYIGANVIQSREATDYNVITASAGVNYFATGSENQYPFYLIGWSGSGGTFNFSLPDADELDGVTYNIYLDDTVDTGKSVFVRPSGSQLINGQTELPLSITGSQTAYKAIDGNWVITEDPSLCACPPQITASCIALYNSQSIDIEAPDAEVTLTLTNTEFSNGITLVSASRLTVPDTGFYNIEFSAQAIKIDGTGVNIYVWIAKNGNNVSWSNTEYHLGAGASDEKVLAWNWMVQANSGDYFEIKYGADDTNWRWQAKDPAPVGPEIPSWIVSMNRII